MADSTHTVVVGAGSAGLAASHYLTLAGIEHVVLERGRAGETWRSQRWDAFALNTSNRRSGFPGQPYEGPNPDGFALKDEFVTRFDLYVDSCRPPLRTGVEVTALEQPDGAGAFRLRTTNEGTEETIDCRSVIVASGFQNVPVTPPISASMPADLLQMHSASYRNAFALPPGAVLVVGSAQSGCQIAEDLLDAGRRVFISTSAVARVPRRYRGRDIVEWFIESGFWDARVEDLEDPRVQFAAQPQVSGVGPLGKTVSLQALARRGAVLLGRIHAIRGVTLEVTDSLEAAIRFADERSAFFKRMVDNYIETRGLTAPPAESDADDLPDERAGRSAPSHVDLRSEDIRAVIWCTGFTGNFDWIRLPVFGPDGRLVHERGVSAIEGLYFLGAPWLSKRKSGVLYGVGEDAEYVVNRLAARD